ncbi:hypothetical protein [Neomoorella thermoacetica]|uniref:hypothetical protein n=1 Tax=Neomoorella thermoacetica TaxID=1525 RepID=UPI0008FAB1EF|nr:hypothetical protein [Moorella thermoacetica]
METIDVCDLIAVERMIYNLELTLEEMQQQALLKGKLEGKLEAQQEIAKNLLLLNVDIDTIIKATGLSPEEINTLCRQLEN